MFYAAKNNYATETGVGFANTWYVLGFEQKRLRDAYVARASDLATRAIKASEIRSYGGRPGQVSYYDAKGELQQWTPMGFTYGCHEIDPATAEPRIAA